MFHLYSTCGIHLIWQVLLCQNVPLTDRLLSDSDTYRTRCVSDCVTRKDSPLDLCPGQPLSLPVLPGLESYNVNPVLSQLHKLEKLEKEHKENKKKGNETLVSYIEIVITSLLLLLPVCYCYY